MSQRGQTRDCGRDGEHSEHLWKADDSPASAVLRCTGQPLPPPPLSRSELFKALDALPLARLQSLCADRGIAVHDRVMERRYYTVLLVENAYSLTSDEASRIEKIKRSRDALLGELDEIENLRTDRGNAFVRMLLRRDDA